MRMTSRHDTTLKIRSQLKTPTFFKHHQCRYTYAHICLGILFCALLLKHNLFTHTFNNFIMSIFCYVWFVGMNHEKSVVSNLSVGMNHEKWCEWSCQIWTVFRTCRAGCMWSCGQECRGWNCWCRTLKIWSGQNFGCLEFWKFLVGGTHSQMLIMWDVDETSGWLSRIGNQNEGKCHPGREKSNGRVGNVREMRLADFATFCHLFTLICNLLVENYRMWPANWANFELSNYQPSSVNT